MLFRSKAGKTEKAAPKEEPRAAAPGASGGNVSMSELRDMIDNKIAEVRSRREPTPSVQVRSASGKAAAAATPRRAKAAAPAAEASGAHGADQASHGRDVHWAYMGDTGPESWGRLKPEFQTCMIGKRQSPIDIRDGIPVQLDPIQFDYRSSGFRVIDNGHTVQVNIEPGNSIQVNGRRYELVEFHFHRPSEEIGRAHV